MTNREIARVLLQTASLLELTGGNPFRARAYENAARKIERMEESLAELAAEDRLTDISGIGGGLSAQIEAFIKDGSFALRDELLAQIPPGLPALLHVKGLGVKKIRVVWKELGVESLEQLQGAAESGRLAGLSGFGERTQQQVLQHVLLVQKYRARRRYAHLFFVLEPILSRLRETAGVERAEPSGEFRRQLETMGIANLIASGTDPAAVGDTLAEWLDGSEAANEGPDVVFRGTLMDGLPLEVRLVEPHRFGTAWWRETGSEAHVAAYESLFGAPDDLAEESQIFERAGLAFIEPELRENLGELEAARADALPVLVEVSDLQGTLHNHSTYSDGGHTLSQMAAAAREVGLSYLGICDHSRSLTIASGMSIEQVIAQQEEIRLLNEKMESDGGRPFRILAGIESDILADGSLDYPDEVLASFDFVIASVHSGFKMTEDEATRRVIRAVENPYTSILGHMTGRILLSREGYPIDHERVIDACARNGVAIELNANPYRLDMDWRWIRMAIDRGVWIAINPDAHSIEELDNVRWGIAVARKGWLTAERCLNALTLNEITKWMHSRRERAAV